MMRRQASRRMSRSVVMVVFCLVGSISAAGCQMQERGTEKSRWISLFDGESLDGWTPKFAGHELGENYNDTFRVEDGLLTVSYDQYERFGNKFGHLFYTRRFFSHYRLRLEYRFIGDQVPEGPGWAFRNNGIMVHCQPPEGMAVNQNFPVSIEVQLLGGPGTGERSTGNLCTPGTNVVMDGELVTQHCISSDSQTYHGDQWVTAEVEIHGSRLVRHIINGEIVMEYAEPQLDPRDADAKRLLDNPEVKQLLENGEDLLIDFGYIALQAESHPTQFRNIEILPLEP